MAKQSGLGDNCYIGDIDISGDVGSLGAIANARAASDVTGINKSAHERLLLAKDGRIDFNSFFNPADGTPEPEASHYALRDLPTSDVLISYFRGTTLGNVAASMVGKQLNYDGSRGADGSFSFAVSAQSNGYGLEWGRMLTAGKVLDQDAGSLTSLDYGAAIGTTAFGLQAYLHVFAIASGTATVAIQQSSDNGAGDAFANVTGGVFTAVSAPGWERIQTSRTESIERYLRLNLTGTFQDLDFAVVVVKNEAEVLF